MIFNFINRKETIMKKSYVRPQLVKHGNVETLTQTAMRYGPSVPCITAL
jgi:hypothetical protein